MKRNSKTNKTNNRPMAPSIEEAIRIVGAVADSTMLPQIPYASYVDGFGWCVNSTTCHLPSNADHVYNVSVVPARFFEPVQPLW